MILVFLMGIDEFIQQKFGNQPRYLVEAGCQDIKKSISSHTTDKHLYETGFKKIRTALIQDKGVDLTPLTELGYERLRIVNSNLREYDVLRRARHLGCVLDEEKIANNAYKSITNLGAEKLQAVEQILEIKLNPRLIAEEAYKVLKEHCPDYSFSPRALKALAYAVKKGISIDIQQLPEPQKLEATIQELLPTRIPEAVEHLQNMQRWGITLVSPQALAILERTAQL